MSYLGHWASSEWCPVVFRPFCSSPVTSSSVQTTLRSQRQFRTLDSLENRMQNSTGTLELTQPLGPYSTHGKQEIPPTNGWLGGATHPLQLHTSMQSVPWPPSYSLTTTTSILDPPWAMPTGHLQDWPASTCLGPNVLELSRHAYQMSRLFQLCPVTSSVIQWCPVMYSYIQITQKPSRSTKSSAEPWNTWKTWKSLAILENHLEHPVHRAGATIMAHTHPSICGACMLPHHP